MASYRAPPSDRAKAIAAVALIHAGLAVLILHSPDRQAAREKRSPTVLIDLREPPPAEPSRAARRDAGAAGKRAEPTPLVKPAPTVALPATPPVVAAPIAGTGSAASAGSASAGSGTGGGGTGAGSGRGGAPARWLEGGLRDSDYPREALRKGVSGSLSVRFTVLTTGHIANCRAVRSSGSALLDSTTCRLLTERLRFAPARDASGRPVESELGSDYGWGLRRR